MSLHGDFAIPIYSYRWVKRLPAEPVIFAATVFVLCAWASQSLNRYDYELVLVVLCQGTCLMALANDAVYCNGFRDMAYLTNIAD